MLAQILRRAISGTGRRNPNTPKMLLRSIISPRLAIFIPKPTPTQPPPPTPLLCYIFRNSSEATNIPPQTPTTTQTSSPNPEPQNPPPKTHEPENSSHSETPPEQENSENPKTPSQILTSTTNPNGAPLPVHLMTEVLLLVFKKAREIEESDIWKVFILASSFFGVLMTLWMLYKKFREEASGESKKQLIVKIGDKMEEQTIVFKGKIEEVKDDIKEVKGKVKKGFKDVKGGLKKLEEAIGILIKKNGVDDDGEEKE